MEAETSTAGNGSAPAIDAGQRSGVKELRLALVCYGGVSLAIYMHGITVELQRLVHASKVYCEGKGANPFPAGTTERVYWDALGSIARSNAGIRLRVVLDVIAGSSAGGINGVALAKSLACGVKQDPLREVWLSKASILKLLVRSPWRILSDGLMPPLNGTRISRWAFDALSAMNAQPVDRSGTSLMPPGHALELFVTTTDCRGYRRTLDLYHPETVHDIEHRHVFRFRHDDRQNQFDSTHDRALTLASRCTSSFPGAFPPVTFKEMQEAVGDFADDDARKNFCSLYFNPYLYEGADPEKSYLVDGGVLNNKPFENAIRAIAERPADHEVDRRLLFIEPHPKEHSAPTGDGRRPSWLKTIFAALSSIPSHQPIADALTGLAADNERAREFQRLIAVAEDSVRGLIEKAGQRLELGDVRRLPELGIDALTEYSNAIQADTRQACGAMFDAYEAVKIGSVIGDLADGICGVLGYPPDSRPAALVRRILRSWAEGTGVLTGPGTPVASTMTAEKRAAFLRSYDLDFRRRRIRFMVRRVNEMYRDDFEGKEVPSREQLDEVKSKLYRLITTLRHIQTGGWIADQPAAPGPSAGPSAAMASRPDLKAALTQIFGWETMAPLGSTDQQTESAARQLSAFVAERRSGLDAALGLLHVELKEQLQVFWDRQEEVFTWLLSDPSLPESLRKAVLERYVGFPYWDAVLYPLVAVSGLAEIDPVEVIRLSPADTVLLQPKGAERRLKGISVFHFGAFFRRKYRENDFLWGRLDGVERILWVLNDAAQGHDTALAPDLSWRGLRAVLETEQSLMTESSTRELIQQLLDQVEQQVGGGERRTNPDDALVPAPV